jgi:hypothetical protein
VKTIIDTLTEVIKKDASTQTDPVIIESEEEMIKVISYGEQSSISKKRDQFHKEIRHAQLEKIFTERRKEFQEYLSGIEHVEEEIKVQEQEQIKSDASFYDKCKSYLDAVDHDKQNYYSIKQNIETDVLKDTLTLDQCTRSIMATNLDNYETLEEKKDLLKILVSSMYVLYMDMSQILTEKGYDDDYFQELLFENMSDKIGVEVSGEVIDFLKHYEE